MSSVAVVGGGIGGLTAAWELVRAGVQVDLYEAADRLGGSIAPATLCPGGGMEAGELPGQRSSDFRREDHDKAAGGGEGNREVRDPRERGGVGAGHATAQLASGINTVVVDAGAEAFATRTPAVREFLTELGLDGQIVSPNPAGAWLQLPDLAAPLPATGILGIPGDPEADDVVRILGADEAARAAEDLTAPMTWSPAQSPSLGEVVADRMGPAVLAKLVAPITSGVHSADPYDLPISTAHPKLFSFMLAEGSLARAVEKLRAAAPAGSSLGVKAAVTAHRREASGVSPPGSAVQSLHGGMNTLISALETQLREFGARIHLSQTVCEIPSNAGSDTVISLNSTHRPGAEGKPDLVVLAVDAAQAAGLLAEPVAAQRPAASGVALVTLLVHAPELDAHPRGTGILVAPAVEGIGAKAMTHISAKWAWTAQALQARLGPGHHLVRLSYGRLTRAKTGARAESSETRLACGACGALPEATEGCPQCGQAIEGRAQSDRGTGDDAAPLGYHTDDGALYRAALEDISRLTGISIGPDQVLDHTVVRWRRNAVSPQTHQLQEAAAAWAGCGGPRIALVGESFAGTGLAQVIPHARQAARQLLEKGRGG
ncbi:protoporphyrinogen/coproporphyrinogen oxidase [Nesterenkonia ebinurensis]|uniref:protoporphyrinogen/coproporphyrinogen oxidase n=1 Tax=Nesterenkonia ebinurensis TaxID=2608252 RepID=UPI00123D4E2D|nr:FAD-dependent oxidoreductase [Nesterenkonia ebinurensis]